MSTSGAVSEGAPAALTALSQEEKLFQAKTSSLLLRGQQGTHFTLRGRVARAGLPQEPVAIFGRVLEGRLEQILD